MQNIAEKVADSYRQNRKPVANPGNRVTANRRKLYQQIKERTGGNSNAELDFALSIVRKRKPEIEQYILSHNEVPMDTIEQLAVQAYNIRCKEIDETMNTLQVSEPEAVIFLEEDEAETKDAFNDEEGNYVGELFAPIGIIAKQNAGADEFIDSGLVSGLINTIGGKLDAAQLKRAAQDKRPGIVGALTGGKAEYEALRKYLQDPANVQIKQAVLNGTIKDVSQLPGFATGDNRGFGSPGVGLNIAGRDVIDEIARIKRREMINKALPFIIIGLVLIVFVTIYITKHANRK